MIDVLLQLAAKVDGLTGPDREVDAEIQEKVFGWKPHRIPPDAFGENACDVLTPDGQPMKVEGRPYVYPPKGAVHRGYHCPAWTRDCIDPAFPRDAIRQKTSDLLRGRAHGGGE